jgi:hypothetical protein
LNDVDEYIYWLYAGETVVESQGKVLHNVKRAVGGTTISLKEDAGRGLLGEMRLLHTASQGRGGPFSAQGQNHNMTREGHERATTTKVITRAQPSRRATVTLYYPNSPSNGHTHVDHDVDLAHCGLSLLFQGMHDKLAARLEESTIETRPLDLAVQLNYEDTHLNKDTNKQS